MDDIPAAVGRAGGSRVRYGVGCVALALAYALAGKLGLEYATTHDSVTLVWPPTGIATAAIVLFGYRMVPGVALGAFLVNASTGAPLGFALATAAGNPLQAVACAWLLRLALSCPLALDRTRHVVAFILAGAASSGASALVGATSLCLNDMAPWSVFESLWWSWWAGDTMGVLLVAPATLAWLAPEDHGTGPFENVETVSVLVAVALVSLAVYGGFIEQSTSRPLSFAVFPLLIWAALRLGARGVATAMLFTAGISIWGAARAVGPFADDSLQETLVLLHAYMSLLSVTTLILASVVSERRQAGAALRRTNEGLERRVEERTARLVELNAVLSTEQERFRSLVESSPSAIFLKDRNGRFKLINSRFEEWYGCSREDALGLTSHDLFRRDDADQYVDMDQRVLASGAIIELETHVTLPDGGRRWLATTKFPVRDMDGELTGVGTINTDITEHKAAQAELDRYRRDLEDRVQARTVALQREVQVRQRAEAELRESEARFRDVASVTSDWIWETDEDLCFTFLSEGLDEVLGVADSSLAGTTYRDLVARVAVPGKLRASHLDDLGAHRPFREVRYEAMSLDGDAVRHLVASGQPVLDARGAFRGYRGAVREVTAEVEAETLAKRQERLAMLGRLTATVSHELRNPLGTIGSSAHILDRTLERSEPRVGRALERIARNVKRCERIIDELLSYARAGQLSRREVRLDDWLAEVLEELEIGDEVKLTCRLDAGVTVSIDPERLRQAVVNVVQNACQSLSENPAQGPHELTVTAESTAEHVAIELADTGPGMDDAVLAEIFEPLFSTRAFGVGLGLPLVKQVLEQHGGEIRVDSTVGRGTIVTLLLAR